MRQPDNPNRPIPDAGDETSRKGSSRRRIAINTISNWVGLGAQTLAGMFLVTYALWYLDKETFGVYQVALSVSNSIQFLAFGMAMANLRVASECIIRQNWEELSSVLSVVRTLMTGAAVIGFAAVVSLTLLGLDVFNIPGAMRAEVTRLLPLVAAGSAIGLVRIPYHSALLAMQRYDLANGVLTGESILRAGIVVVCFEMGWVRLEALGIAIAVSAVLALGALLVMRPILLPQVRVSFLRFKWSAFRRLLGFSAWSMIGNISFTVQQSVVAPLVSALLGLSAVTAVAVPDMVGRMLERVVGGFSFSLLPVATALVAEGRRERLGRLYVTTARIAMLLQVPALAAVITHGQALLACLKPELVWTYPLMVLCVGLFVLHAFGLPATHIIWGSGKVGGVILSHVVAIAVGVGAAVALTLGTNWGVYGAAVGLYAPLALRGLFFMPLLAKRQVQVGYWRTVFSGFASPLWVGVVPVTAGLLLRYLWNPHSLWIVFVQVALLGVVYVAAAWVLVLRPDERLIVLGILRRRAGVRLPGSSEQEVGS
jgi:O-antigen/teichoic acid export membrane protein